EVCCFLIEVTCPLCSTLYDDPVRLDCEHNYCRKCIIKYWNEGETTDGDGDTKGYTCPLCCEIFPQFTLKSNKLLASIVGRVRDLGLQNFKRLCPVHGEPLKMFCVEEKMAICVVCAVSKEHRAHCLAPMEEILTQCEVRGVQDCRQKETDIDSVHGVLFKDRPCVVWHGGRYRIYVSGGTVEQAMLRQRQNMEEYILTKRWASLLLHFFSPLRLKTEPAALEDEAADRFDLGVYRGPLQYAVWKKLAEVIQPALCTLNFDPATANTFLSLSEDLTTAQYSYSPKDGLSIGEACFEFSPCVLASRGFSSGRHYWEVDVGDKSDWDLGVAEETAERAGWVVLCPENGYWTVGNKDARKVGVYLDYEAGQVSFYNAADMTPLFSYVGASFKETLYPFFYPSADSKAEPLKILNPRF
uniref:Zinc-binding protein A33-like n=1 Tax=Scleropages formosus TaxID=113540 RepID=A0A8C9S1J6_SCLFO